MNNAMTSLTSQATNTFWLIIPFAFVILFVILATSGFMGSKAKDFAKEHFMWLIISGVGISSIQPIVSFLQSL